MGIEEVKNYIDSIYEKTKDQRLKEPGIFEDIKQKLYKASQITNFSIPVLLSRLSFKPNDKTIEALESFLAELRAIFWLKNFGFTEITPLGASNSQPQPDFTAKFNSKDCAIEVFCLTHTHQQQKDSSLGVYVNFDPCFEGSKFRRDFISKASEKKKQLDARNDVEIKILLCVVNSSPIIYLNDKKSMQSHAGCLYDKLKWGDNYFVGLLTGANINGELTDVIYPKLSN